MHKITIEIFRDEYGGFSYPDVVVSTYDYNEKGPRIIPNVAWIKLQSDVGSTPVLELGMMNMEVEKVNNKVLIKTDHQPEKIWRPLTEEVNPSPVIEK